MSRKEDKRPATLRSFAVLESLVAAERPASLTEIVKASALPKPTVYRMLAMLESAGLVVRVRKSRSLIYSADFAAMTALVGYLTENCCGGASICA